MSVHRSGIDGRCSESEHMGGCRSLYGWRAGMRKGRAFAVEGGGVVTFPV